MRLAHFEVKLFFSSNGELVMNWISTPPHPSLILYHSVRKQIKKYSQKSHKQYLHRILNILEYFIWRKKEIKHIIIG